MKPIKPSKTDDSLTAGFLEFVRAAGSLYESFEKNYGEEGYLSIVIRDAKGKIHYFSDNGPEESLLKVFREEAANSFGDDAYSSAEVMNDGTLIVKDKGQMQ